MAMYRTTYYPAAATAGAATPIALASGDERTDLTISVRPVGGGASLGASRHGQWPAAPPTRSG